MPNRVTRVNELLQREIGEQLRRHFGGSQSVRITISEVDTSSDLRRCNIYYSVIGDAQAIVDAEAFFRQNGKELRERVMKRVVLKYFPRFEFIYDPSMEQGANLIELMKQLDDEND
jgi:ribosome-binding factor A